MSPTKYIPALDWLRRYRRADLPGDVIASVIVTIMLIPQSLAYALLANLPPEVGLYASITPLIAYALFGSSRALAVGPVAVVSLMTASAIGGIAAPGTPEHWAAALLLALISGLFLLVLGVARLGFLANLLSHPVISGFISASAILIAASQVKHILGIRISGERLHEILLQIAEQIGAVNWITGLIGVASLAFLFWVRSSLAPTLQRLGLSKGAADLAARAGPVAAVLAATVSVAMLRFDQGAGVKIVGAIPAGLPPLTLPSLDPQLWVDLIPAAVLIAIVGFVESVSVAQSLAAKRRQKIDPDQELVGLGAANIAAALTGGYPVTGGFARSVVNFAAGANTQLAAMLTAILIAVATVFLTPLFFYMPEAVLAATIIVAVLGLVDVKTLRHAWHYSKADAVSLIATAAMVLLFGVETGIMVGVGVSIGLYLWRTSRPHVAIVGQVPGTEHYRNVLRHSVITKPGILALRVDESLYFINARYLEDKVAALVAEQPQVRHFVLICSAINFIDASALESLETIGRNLSDAGVKLHLTEVKGPVMDRLRKVGFTEYLTGEVFLSTHQAFQVLSAGTSEERSAQRANL
ncbi:SulP family inorganic anion transporter [Microvirga sp. GCM10011540]|uniref:SulP family inorganic anion transporter n=1 Tax=Microvirga sp. GCM10011540 TaxID=3317338 RepID=UPI0036094F67